VGFSTTISNRRLTRTATRSEQPPARHASQGGALLRIAMVAFLVLGLSGIATPKAHTADPADGSCPALLRYTFNGLQTGKPQSLCEYRGKVLVIVNTASYCAYTKQYEGLEALYRKYKDRGLVVIGFPSNDFGSQEPGSNKEIAQFCRTTYGVEFPMFEKSSVARLDIQPLYATLVKATGQAPKWNFHKYVVDRTGTRVESFGSSVEPGQREFVASVERLLAAKP
jgi:glutathione peroxidase